MDGVEKGEGNSRVFVGKSFPIDSEEEKTEDILPVSIAQKWNVTEHNFSNFLEISVSSIITTIKLNLLEGYVQVLGYWADDWKSHPIKWITSIANQPQTRAGQGGHWQALARWHRKDGWCTPCQEWGDDWEENEGLPTFQFSFPSQESETPAIFAFTSPLSSNHIS